MKRICLTLIGLIIVFSAAAAWDYETKRNHTGDFEQSTSWKDGHAPSSDGDVNRKMTINGTITRNGNLTPVNVTVKETFVVNGDYHNNQWGGLSIQNGARVEIFGNLEGAAGISVNKGGVLIVHGNLSSTGSSLKTSGDVVVKGDFYTSSNTHVQNKGNLVVGGDFTHEGGGLMAKSDDIYILDPDANITSPGSGIIENGDYGDLDNFVENEGGSDLEDIVENIGLISPVFKWVGKENSDWSNASNWQKREVPENNSSVKIESSEIAPNINGDITVAKLEIAEGASLLIKSEATLEITTKLVNDGTFVLDNDFGKAPAAMIPPVDNTIAGEADVLINGIPANAWIKLGHPVRAPKASIYNVGGTEKVDSWIYRVFNGWQQIHDPELELKEMGGINAWYAPKDGSSTYDLNYQGNINTGEASYEVEGGGYYLLSNPFTSAIDWAKADGNGWDRSENVSKDLYHRVHVGSGISDYEFVYNGETGVSQVLNVYGYNENNVSHIAPLSSVWIFVKDKAPAHVRVNNKARVRSEIPLKRASSGKKDYELIRVTSQRSENLLDGAVLYFDQTFEQGIDYSDSEKKLNSSKEFSEVYFKVDNKKMSLNGMPQIQDNRYEFPLSVRNRKEGQVNLSFNLDKFTENYDVFLQDKMRGIWTNLKVIPDYAYIPAELGENDNRFVIHIQKVKNEVATSVENVENQNATDITIKGYSQYVAVDINNSLFGKSKNAIIEILDINGRLIKRQISASAATEINLPEESGVYILRVNVGGVIKTGKVVRR